MASPPRQRVAALDDLAPGTSRKFTLTCGAATLEGFLINYRGTHYAYGNECQHLPMTMDWVENRFFDAAGAYLVCGTHGATYEPHTGLCVAGPCVGEVLRALPVFVENGGIWVGCPATTGL